MNLKNSAGILLAFLLSVSCQAAKASSPKSSAKAEKPNIVLLLIDDWAWNGTPVAMEDQVDAIQVSGVRFGLGDRCSGGGNIKGTDGMLIDLSSGNRPGPRDLVCHGWTKLTQIPARCPVFSGLLCNASYSAFTMSMSCKTSWYSSCQSTCPTRFVHNGFLYCFMAVSM
jgi:hypothetical protein